MNHSIFTHSGTLTIKSPTGEHRTFRVRTVPDDSEWAPGERVLELLTGPDNTADYTGFAFVKPDRITVWKRLRGGVYDVYARNLANPAPWESKGAEFYWEHVCCRRCGRPLTTPESLERGIGPVCMGLETEKFSVRV